MSNDKTLELQIRIAAEEAARIVSALKGDMKALSDEAGRYAKGGGEALNKSFKEAETAAKDTVTGIGEIKRAIGSLTEVVAAAKALSVIKDMGTFALETADSFQTAKNQFGILLGDMRAGAGLFNEIKAFNDVTPFDLDTLTQATNVLISAKVPLQDLQNQLTKFGDLSQGNSQRLTSYIHAFSIAAAKGKADMQVLNTYLNQGVPILDALAKNFNVTTAEIIEMSSNGQISFADFSRALDDLTAAGGQYFGGMELASQSLTAMQEGLNEAVNSLAASFGEMLLPAAVGVVGALTEITNAINDSPIAKGLFAGALVALAGYLAAMAVKAGIAFAAQMKLNLAVGVLNPVVMASTVAVAGLVAGYTLVASQLQKNVRETENLALTQRKQKDATRDSLNALQEYRQVLQQLNLDETLVKMGELQRQIDQQRVETARSKNGKTAPGGILVNSPEIEQLNETIEHLKKLRTDFIKEFSEDRKIIELENRVNIAQKFIVTVDISQEDKTALENIIKAARDEIATLTGDLNSKATKWKSDWAAIWKQFQLEQMSEIERIDAIKQETLDDAWKNGVRGITANQDIIDQINEYYEAQRLEVINRLAKEEKRIQAELSREEGQIRRGLTRSRVDDIVHELHVALDAIDTIEAQRITAAADSEEEIAAIREHYAQMRSDTSLRFKVEIDTTQLEEARESVKNWQEELSDNLLKGLMNLEMFGNKASVIIADLTTQLIELAATASLSGFEELGRAFGEGADGAEALSRALAQMAQQILRQLPMMFLQAGLQLIANGQWQLGLGFIAAATTSAFLSGLVDGEINSAQNTATQHAQGGVFDEYGQVARAYAAGGVFTNQIVSAPTYFAHGGGFGLMGEAGPEAIMPLTRMSNGNLGVQTAGSRANVTINIRNYSGAEVRQEESEGADGSKKIEITIGEMINRHLASGKADRVMGGRFGARASGV